eukprot:m.340236 g.340236  ORF g.340236 m.340236 type:complete len:243 (+) comp19826_c0_seq6:194-922(+)
MGGHVAVAVAMMCLAATLPHASPEVITEQQPVKVDMQGRVCIVAVDVDSLFINHWGRGSRTAREQRKMVIHKAKSLLTNVTEVIYSQLNIDIRPYIYLHPLSTMTNHDAWLVHQSTLMMMYGKWLAQPATKANDIIEMSARGPRALTSQEVCLNVLLTHQRVSSVGSANIGDELTHGSVRWLPCYSHTNITAEHPPGHPAWKPLQEGSHGRSVSGAQHGVYFQHARPWWTAGRSFDGICAGT